LAKHGSERPARRGSAYATNQSTAETWRGRTRGRHSERPRGDSRVEDNGPGPALVVDNTLDRYLLMPRVVAEDLTVGERQGT